MVSKASDDFPEPDSPVKTTSLSRGMVRSMSFRLCSRAPLITISVCWPRGPGGCLPLWGRGGVGVFWSATDASPHATGLWLAPHPRFRGGRRRQRASIFHGVATQGNQPVPQFRGPLEVQVAGRLLHLAFEVFDKALDLVRRQPGRERRDRFFNRFLLLLLEVVDRLHDAGRCDAVVLVVGEPAIRNTAVLLDRPLHRAAER